MAKRPGKGRVPKVSGPASGRVLSAKQGRPALLAAEMAFDRPLAELPCLVEGWCEPEEQFSWTIGPRSRLLLPAAGPGAYSLILQGHPFLPPGRAAQLLTVAVNGHALAALTVDGLFTHLVRIPAGVIGDDSAEIAFGHPDCDSPARHGGSDTRMLGIRFWHIRLFRAQAGAPARSVPGDSPGALQQLDALELLGQLSEPERRLCGQLRGGADAADAASNPVFHALFAACLGAGYALAASWLAARAPGGAGVAIGFDGTVGSDPSVVRFTARGDGGWAIGLPPALLALARAAGRGCTMIVWRLLAMLPMLSRYAGQGRPAGTCLINLGDEGHTRGVAFCNVRSMDTLLVPDPYFLRTQGYEAQRGAVVPWADRRPVAFWRGAATGYPGAGGALDLPRVRLCRLASLPGHDALLDAKLTDTGPLGAEDAALLRRLGLLGTPVPTAAFQSAKYAIDMDGNTNAWSGLFGKLLSGSAVLKVGSDYRQWYYDRLRPFETHLPVERDLSDLAEKIRILQANDQLAASIGARGRALALSLGYESEMAAALDTLEAALLIETHTPGLAPVP